MTAELQAQVQQLKQQLVDSSQLREHLPDAAVVVARSLSGQSHAHSVPPPPHAVQQQQAIEQPTMQDWCGTDPLNVSTEAGTPIAGPRARMTALQQQLAQLQVQLEASTKERAELRGRMNSARGSAIRDLTSGAAGLRSVKSAQPEALMTLGPSPQVLSECLAALGTTSTGALKVLA